MDNIIEVQFNEMLQRTRSIWQYDYGQVLKILSDGVVLPNFLEVHFSLSRENEKCITRIGTTVNGVTEVQIPNELLNTENKTHDYFIYAFIYVSTEKYGNTKCEIIIPVKSRIKPENPSEEPLPEPNIFHETVESVNAAADRAKMAEQNAKASATEAGKYAASASESAVTAEKTKEDALRKVGEKKQEAIEAIQNQEETSVGKITTHTDGEIQRIQNQVAESKGELEQTIINAGVSEEELDESIQTASDTKTALDKSVELAGTAKTELDTSIREAGTAKTALDGSAKTAGEMQETLSATVKQAGTLDTSLGEKIETGTQLKTDLTVSGEKSVQDIQTAGSEQLDKMQAVAEAFTADREQIATNKEDIGSLKEDLSNKITKFYASNQGETHITDSDNGKIQDMIIYGRSSQFTTTGKNLAHGKNEKYYINTSVNLCGFNNDDIGMAIDVSNLTNVTISTRSIQDRYRIGCVDTVPTDAKTVTCYNGRNKDGTKDSYTIDTKDYNYLIVNATKLEDIQVEKGSEATSYEPYTGGIPSPSPDYPQEIKAVVNPKVVVRGKNLLKATGQTQTINGVTFTNNSDGTYTVNGTSTANALTFFTAVSTFTIKENGKYKLTGLPKGQAINDDIWFGGTRVESAKEDVVLALKKGDILNLVFIVRKGATLNNVLLKPMLSLDTTATYDDYEPYTEQSVTLPYTLYAIPVSTGGNVTIGNQQYVADYVDVERGKVVRMCGREAFNTKNGEINEEYRLFIHIGVPGKKGDKECIFSTFKWTSWTTWVSGTSLYIKNIKKPNNELYTAQELKELSIDFDVIYQLLEQQETDLTPEQTQALKELVTYYPVTNISVNSEQLDGYTVFNYPISMKNGWDYVKKQLNDNRDYIYDMDIQSAEAYVNSEYAVALAELEV
ncbi:hypothetical protein JCM37173_33120 [Allocoprococcus similis]